jgi:PAS domain S-box-containing protein
MSLSTRLTLAMVGLVLLTALAVGWLTYRNLEAAILPRALDRVETRVRASAVDLDRHVRGPRSDILGFRSAVALEGLVRASFAGGRDPIDGTSLATWRDRMAARYVAELTNKPSYTQFRIIGVADGGRELLRVDRSGPAGAIRVVPEAELQQKGDRGYFQEAIKIGPDDIYVSAIDLNQENGVIETPHVPTVRVAAVIQTPDHKPFGIVIINVDMRPLFNEIRSEARPGNGFYVINDRGDYLVHPDKSREFGFELGRPFRWQDEYLELARSAASNTSGSYVITDTAGERGAAGVAWVRPGGGPRVAVIEVVPNATMMAPAAAVRRASLLVGVAAVLCAALIAVWLARSFARPLVQMTRAVEGFAGGQPVSVPTDARGEIGVLARAFNRMVTDSKEKTAALQESEQMARGIIESALDAFVQMDESGCVVDWNSQAEAIFGWSRDEAVGKVLADLIVPAAHRKAHKEGLARYLRTGESSILGKRFEIAAERRDGRELKVELSVTALRRGGKYVFNAFIRDLTEQRAAEEQLRQSQKMESVGQLTGGIAHDFNNILTVITGTIDILAESVADKPQMAAIAKMIDDAADRGANLTRHLLAFARKQPLQPRNTDINALIVESAKLLRPTLGEHVEIESMLEDDAWTAMVDPNQLTTAVVNLAINARDAMPQGGRLTLETGNVYLDESYTHVHQDVAPGPYVMIAVSDTGTGIPAAIRDKVFEPFFTTKGTGKGTGLGLSMVYGFVKQSAGHIKIYSEEGHGTTIKIYLPRAGHDATQTLEASASAAIEGGNETIMVVEDDDLVRNYVVAQIRSMGYTPLAAPNAAEALKLIDDGAPFDLLFTDVIMPGSMNGRELADEAVKRRPSLKVLFTSGYTENAIVHHGRLDPGVLLLAKPYRKSDLARMIRTALDVAQHAAVAAP